MENISIKEDLKSRIKDFKYCFYRQFLREGIKENQGESLLGTFENHLNNSISDYSLLCEFKAQAFDFCYKQEHNERKAKTFLSAYNKRPPELYYSKSLNAFIYGKTFFK